MVIILLGITELKLYVNYLLLLFLEKLHSTASISPLSTASSSSSLRTAALARSTQVILHLSQLFHGNERESSVSV
ncbi:PREDICTED: uncharacterized protein LOC109214358 isoform X2 [Nicotiana attenuata]|uniref:uncharacterized protein LOC109214358 isoform X2 n=1 Tax=Nicotiana attenuata TaxID=49451 RepID=UPI000905153D|nr:PREDICTED: uncharacterized protein LOC109214358 isoform X2 [Nicotiana attenuata]